MFGGAAEGRSEQGTAMALEVDDPAHNFSAFIDYEQMHGKGPLLGRGGYGYPYYRDSVDGLLQPGQFDPARRVRGTQDARLAPSGWVLKAQQQKGPSLLFGGLGP